MAALSPPLDPVGTTGLVLVVLTVVSAPIWFVGLGLSFARWRVPALAWWLPPAMCVAITATLGTVGADAITAELATADPATVPVLARDAEVLRLTCRALGLLWAAAWLGVTALNLAWVLPVRAVRPVPRWLDATLPLAAGVPGLLATGLAAAFSGADLLRASLPTALAALGIAATSVAASRSSEAPEERARLGAGRGALVALAIAAPLALGLGLHELGVADTLAHLDRNRPLPVALPAAVTAALAVAGAGLPGLSTAREAWSLRTLASSALGFVLVVAAGVALGLTRPDAAALEAALGGAVARLPDTLWTSLPLARDLDESEVQADPLDGSCLVAESIDGWSAEPLFAARPPADHVARHVPDPDAVHELDRTAGCPAERAPLDGPFAASEIPVVAADGRRAAAALAGQIWFREQGSLRVLVQPGPMATADTSSLALRASARAVPVHWRLPERVEPPPDLVPGEWHDALAATLPVTLLEGPHPVLVAGGMRSRLPAGELGADTLRLVLDSEPIHRRDLVIVARKYWTIQDVLGYCLAVQGRVEGARCVLVPERPIDWSLRTGLPLPW